MPTIFTLENLYKAYKCCQKGKKNTINALNFELEREKNLIQLLQELTSRTYKISRHICFIVTNPTAREIFAADFRDRVVHHLLCNEIQAVFEADFIPRSYANRRGKGTHKAVWQLTKDIRQLKSRIGGGYYLKLDVESFFRSISRETLYAIVERKIEALGRKTGGGGGDSKEMDLMKWQNEVLWLAKKIIFHDPTLDYVYKGDPKKKALIPQHKSLFSGKGCGLPIGNLTSQFFANVYLNELDKFVTKTLGLEKYVRYVDDFVMVDEDRDKLRSLIVPINCFLNKTLNLRIHRGKICLQNIRNGIDFLGYFIKPTHTLVRQKVVRRLKNRLRDTQIIAEKMLPMINSYYGHFRHANSFSLRKHFYEKHLDKDVKKCLIVDKGYKSLVLRE